MIIPVLYWLSYPEMVKLSDGVPVTIAGERENGYKVTASQLQAAITPKTKALIINTPCSPMPQAIPIPLRKRRLLCIY